MDKGSEKRNFSRIAFGARVELPEGENWQSTRLVDISMKGALIEEAKDWNMEIDSVFTMRLFLRSELPSEEFSQCDLEIKARLVHRGSRHAGFCWEEMELEDFIQLRRLLELNLGSEELLLRELTALVQAD